MAITTKKVLYLLCGSISYIAVLETSGNARSINAIIMAQNMSSANIFLCGLKYLNKSLSILSPSKYYLFIYFHKNGYNT